MYLFSRLRSNRRIPWVQCERATAYFESYATDVFITPCLPPCFVEGKNSVALINVAIKFGDEYFCFGIYFSKIFFVTTFFEIFFFLFLSDNFFFKIFFLKFFFQIFFQLFFNIFFWALHSRFLPVYRGKTDSMYLCYEKYDKQAVEIGL